MCLGSAGALHTPHVLNVKLPQICFEKSQIRETLHLLACAVSSPDTKKSKILKLNKTKFKLNNITWHLSHVVCHLSLTPTATATYLPPANSPTLWTVFWFTKTTKLKKKNLNAKLSSKLQKCLGVCQFSYMLFSQKPQSQTV